MMTRLHTKPKSIWHMDALDVLAKLGFSRRARVDELAVFCRKAAFLLDAGLTLRDALPLMVRQSTGRIALATREIHKHILHGESLSTAIRLTGAFPSFLHSNISVGEAGGKTAAVFSSLADYYEQQAAAKKEITGALMYPAAVAILMLAVLAGTVAFVLPGYAGMFAAGGAELPALTSALLSISDFVMANGLLLVGGSAAVIALVCFFSRRQAGRAFFGFVALRFPLGRLYMNFTLVNALAMLLDSGVGVARGLPLAVPVVRNIYARRRLAKIASEIQTGKSFPAALAHMPYIDPVVLGLAQVGDATGRLDATMRKCHTYLEGELRHSLRRMNKLIEPIITLVLGILLGTVMLALVLPTFELATAF